MSEAAAEATTAAVEGAATGTPAQEVSNAPWYGGFSEDLKGYVENKGWDSPASAIESYRNLEKLTGVPADRIVKLPGEGADPSEWNGVWDRLGKPGDASEYQFPEGGDTDFQDWARKAFHESNVPKGMAEKLIQAYDEFAEQITTQQAEEYQHSLAQQAESLKKEWGAAHDQYLQEASRAAKGLGFTAEAIDALESAMGYDGVMKFMRELGSKMGESEFVAGNSQAQMGNALTPAAARDRITALRSDKDFVARYAKGDISAKTEMERLHKMAYPD